MRIVFAALLLAACAHTSAERLTEALDAYHESVRWSAPRQADRYLSAERRTQLAEALRRERGELEIGGYEIESVTLDEDKKAATVRVLWSWHRRSEGILRETLAEQRWERTGREWVLVAEKRAGGAPLAWLP